MIDRLAPTNRPKGPNAGTQSWQSLLFCHWEIPIETLRAIVPRELEIDTFDGRAFVGLVPFKMRAIRPRWLPKAMAFNFLETNVRTYVVHSGRPGVYFFSLDANSRLAVVAARAGWSLPYFHAHMTQQTTDELQTYASQRRDGTSSKVSFRIQDALGTSQPGSLEHFLMERYLLFVQRGDQICVGQVHHKPYPVFAASIDAIEDGLLPSAGAPPQNLMPDLSHYSSGVDVEVFEIKRA